MCFNNTGATVQFQIACTDQWGQHMCHEWPLCQKSERRRATLVCVYCAPKLTVAERIHGVIVLI